MKKLLEKDEIPKYEVYRILADPNTALGKEEETFRIRGKIAEQEE